MRYKSGIILLLILCWCLVGTNTANAQSCASKYYSYTFKGSTYDTFSRVLFTPTGDIVAAGQLLDYNGAAHLARYSKNGTPIWSNYYTIGFFTFYNPTFLSKVRIYDMVLTPDGGMVVAGSILQYYNNRVSEIYSHLALLAKIDKYGIVQWTRTYHPRGTYPDLAFNNIIQTSDGDFIAYMSQDKGPSLFDALSCHNRVLRFSATGQIKWVSELYTGHYDAGGTGFAHSRGLTQLADKNIAVADVVYQVRRNVETFRMFDSRLHFLSLDYATGKPVWESSYPYTLPPADTFFVPSVEDITQLPDNRLSINTSLYLSTPISPALSKKPVTLIASSRGVVEKLVTISASSGNPLYLKDVNPGSVSGTKKILLGEGNTSAILTIDAGGNPLSIKAFSGSFPPNRMAESSRGAALLMSNNQSLYYQLLLTDANGNAACADATASLITETLPPDNVNPAAVLTLARVYTELESRSFFTDKAYPLIIKAAYPLQPTVDCEEPLLCCKDVVDSTHINTITLCEGSTYTLPDNTVVKEAGTYFVTNRTAGGCDSITFTKLVLDKNLSALTLGNDTCLTGQSRITLRATPGYKSYSWMGSVAVPVDTFRVAAPGIYKVKVVNSCGSKTDSVEVYDRCDFPVYLPTAFTPNRDFLNDDFGVPLQNKNRLISLRIYNRWGEIVFETNSVYKKWDGTYKNQPLKTDIFLYQLDMNGLSGNFITQKGTVLLIR
ncbi:MAG: gliding motility-associated C-terminal domain-containing protein [Bacteroidetes bacterium]|nr:gliding motility-associated C-terminal domain-containing protein [Bacteroidota bacterium]